MPKVIYNPFTGNFDFISAADPTPEPINNYSQLFDQTDWVSVSGNYEIEIDAITHEHLTNPQVQVFELNVDQYVLVEVEIFVDADGLVTLQVPGTPDLRFEGKVIIG